MWSCPIFIARQWIRHRTANCQRVFGPLFVMPDRFYVPSLDNVRQQSLTNRQGGVEPVDMGTAQEFLDYLERCHQQYVEYEKLLEKGVSRELARLGLPVNVYTEWYWKCDLHNLLHFLSLRMDEHAQQEIRDYANAMFALIQPDRSGRRRGVQGLSARSSPAFTAGTRVSAQRKTIGGRQQTRAGRVG